MGERALLEACAALFSSDYGVWGPGGPAPGERIRFTADRVAELLQAPESYLTCAFEHDQLAGYCVALFVEVPDRGRVAWVSQLVVASRVRNAGIATALLFSIWNFSDCYAWGLATASPFAVRALESATRRPVSISALRQHGNAVLAALSEQVPYLPPTLETDGERPRAAVDTKFHISHEGVAEMKQRAARRDRPWSLGEIAEGEEWLACTFRSQEPEPLEDRKLNDILVGADRVWLDAFARMTLDDQHAWHNHTDHEIDVIERLTHLRVPSRVLDIGCGDGRHAIALAQRGHSVVGVDVVDALVERARTRSPEGIDVRFEVTDARNGLPDPPFDLVLLLYDVLGASARKEDDLLILQSAARRLAPGGRLVLSVMNTDVTRGRLEESHRPSDTRAFVRALEDLAPSDTMASTGDIFDPSLLLLFQGVYYRKEQFISAGEHLPREYVVRDRRYGEDELRSLLEQSGFDVVHLAPVQGGKWDRTPPLARTDRSAKELLAVAVKRG